MPKFQATRENTIIASFAILYVIANGIATSFDFYYLNLMPAIVLIVFLAFARLDIVYFIIIASTPVSISLLEITDGLPIDMYIPSEPMLFGVMLIVMFKSFRAGYLDKRIIYHPITLAILFNLIWVFITSITSTMPMVSFKFLLARVWFLTTYYLVAIHIFKNPANVGRFVWCYTLPLIIVIVYAISRHLSYGLFDDEAAHFVMNPFYRDHTSYGAVLAMVIFAFVGVNLFRKISIINKLFVFGVFTVVLTGLILSYTRAAWGSVVICIGILIVVLLRIKFKYLAIASIVILFYFLANKTNLIFTLERNNQDSSTDLIEHIQSMSNIATDASNLERLNRWKSAFRMFKEEPIFGWGPGTYMFNYAPFQMNRDKTIISTNFGDLGNAHSEYIGPLAESGVLGSLSFLLIAILSLTTGFKVYARIKDKQVKVVTLFIILGLITYLLHGVFNNYLDTDKASALFWGFTAVIVSFDLFYKEDEQMTDGIKRIEKKM